jgi:O-succinylbenzoic acid--CoA ligase
MEQQLKQCPVRHQALQQPQALAIAAKQRSLTYRELDQQLCYLEEQLAAQGVKTGDRLACIAANSLNLILLQLSCMRSGIIFCPLNPRFSIHEIKVRLAILNTPFIWSSQTESKLTSDSLQFDFTPPANAQSNELALPINPQQVSNIIFTSGSSGLPKAVMHSFSNHYYSALGSQTVIPLQQTDRNLLSLPIFHISGYATVFRTLYAGATLLLSSEKLSVELLKRESVTHLSLVATQLYRLLKSPQFKQSKLSIKHLLLGGSAFSKQLLKQTVQRGFTYHLSYGLTEMSSQVATSCNDQSLTILKYREVKIVENEIYLRGKTRFVGYFNGQLKESIIPSEQWFASKDLGRKEADRLQITGRKDRQFICGGENIQPEEIESLLVDFPAVRQAYVVAVSDPAFGKRPVAFIDWQEGETAFEQLNEFIRSKLTSFKCPSHYFQLLPQTGLKVSLADLSKQAEKNLQQIQRKQNRFFARN